MDFGARDDKIGVILNGCGQRQADQVPASKLNKNSKKKQHPKYKVQKQPRYAIFFKKQPRYAIFF